jgi:hypothetical protein
LSEIKHPKKICVYVSDDFFERYIDYKTKNDKVNVLVLFREAIGEIIGDSN